MDKIGNPYMDYYYLDETRVYNENTKRYLRMNNHQFKLLGIDGKRHSVSLKELYDKVYHKPYCTDDIEDLKGEIWKPIENSNGNYWISNLARIKSYKDYNAKILKAQRTDNNYMRVTIDFTGNGIKSLFVHRLVAEYFLDSPSNLFLYEIHHKDFNSLNNKADNLQWVTKAEHVKLHREHDKEITKA